MLVSRLSSKGRTKGCMDHPSSVFLVGLMTASNVGRAIATDFVSKCCDYECLLVTACVNFLFYLCQGCFLQMGMLESIVKDIISCVVA